MEGKKYSEKKGASKFFGVVWKGRKGDAILGI